MTLFKPDKTASTEELGWRWGWIALQIAGEAVKVSRLTQLKEKAYFAICQLIAWI